MSNGLSRFLKWLATILLAIIGFLLYIFTRRTSSDATTIVANADAQVAKTAEDIKNDSDKELAARFNSLAKKQERKKDG